VDACPRCGLVYDRWKGDGEQSEHEEQEDDALRELWERVEEGYDQPARHDAFLAACAAREAFVYAAERYRRRRVRAPDDPITIARQQQVREAVTRWALTRPLVPPIAGRRTKTLLYVVLGAVLLVALLIIASLVGRMHSMAN
jgi:hypothetical protein